MNNLAIPSGDSGLSLAWLMATMGVSKPACRRILKRELNDISIPNVCEEVSTIAEEAQHLRLTSNLLYGLSLIYKQKVNYMVSDLTILCDRITAPLFTRKVISDLPNKKEAILVVGKKISYKVDDGRFNMISDFIKDFPDSENDENSLSESLQNALNIRNQDHNTLGFTEMGERPGHVIADAQDKLFLEFMNKSMSAKEVLLDECLMVDFEFNKDGDIIGQDENIEERQGGEILLDLNLDEDFNVVSGSIEDISKSGNHTGNDQNLINLDHSKAIISQAPIKPLRKRRKLKPVVDEILTRNAGSISNDTYLPCFSSSNTVSEIFHSLSLTQPPFLNMCYRMIFGALKTAGMSTEKLPLSSRHPNVSNLDSFLKEIDDIERGRDLPSRRPSLSLFDDDLRGSPFPAIEEAPLDANAFDIDPLSPLLDELEETDSAEVTNEISHRLENFKSFLLERAHHLAEQRNENIRDSVFTLESLIPSTPSLREQAVPRSLAANSFSCLLQLATAGSVDILTTQDEYRLVAPREIYIAFI